MQNPKPSPVGHERGFAAPEPDAGDAGRFPERLAGALAAAYPGAAMFVDADGEVVIANGAAKDLVDYLHGPNGDTLRAGFVSRMTSGGAGNIRISFETGGVERTLELTLTHIRAETPDAGDGILVLARDVTGERNVINALVSSRQLYRDLVECSADFGWETDVKGAFTYVSPQGGFGFTARELTTSLASDLMENVDGGNPFNVDHRYKNVEVWLRRKDGSRACVIVSAVPIHDAPGAWIGTRGMCRDVSMVKAHLQQEQILSRIVDAIRNCVDPRQGLEIAAHQIVEVFTPARSLVAKKTGEGFDLAAHRGFDDEGALRALGHFAAVLEETADQNRPLIEYSDTVSRSLAAPSYHHGEVNGVVLVERIVDEGVWREQERRLLQGIADQFGVAIEQVNSYEALEDLSRLDELTSLLNRRAFVAAVETRIAHQRRTGRNSVLLYLDVDNFKAVNDLMGHQLGDRMLCQIGEIIRTTSRADDIAARVGGDEFLLWLEDTELEGAVAKASALIRDVLALNTTLGEGKTELGLSIGIALSDPAEELTLDGVIQRADEAMYDAKRNGETGWAVFQKGSQAAAC